MVASYFAITSAAAAAYVPAIVSVVGLIGAVSLFASDPRSRFLAYAASAIVWASWLIVIMQLVISGWLVAGLSQSVISLACLDLTRPSTGRAETWRQLGTRQVDAG